MDQQPGQRRSFRRAGLRPLPTPTDLEIVVDDAPPLLEVIDELPEPRIADLDALLREVDTLRSTLRRDLTLAATAVEAGEEELAGWLLLGEGGKVRSFETKALEHLHALEAADGEQPAAVVPAARRRPRMLPAAPFVASAAAVVGVLTGGVPGINGPATTSPRTTNSALQSYSELTRLASAGAPADTISEAAEKFHSALAPLVATAANDPAAAQRAIDLLQSERAVIAGEADSPALRAVLAQADLLVRKLRATLPKTTRVVVPAGPDTRTNTSTKSSPTPKSSASAKPSPSPSPKASPKPSPSASPSPSSSSSSSASPSGGPFPGAPVPH